MKRSITDQSYENYHAIENSWLSHSAIFCLAFVWIITSAHSSCYGQRWDKLFNGKDLKGWDTYIGPPYDSVQKKFSGSSPGLNNDGAKVFSTIMLDGQPALKISGEHFGGISTISEFSNYHFRISFKWGERKYAPKKNDKRDSGVLYHAVGKHGADGGFWMRSQEFQVQEGDCGDYWGVAGGSFEIPSASSNGQLIYAKGGTVRTFNETSEVGRRCIKRSDEEFPTGQWNTLEIICVGDTTVHVMNGKTVMVLYKSAQLSNGKLAPLTKGKIQIQSEGAEVFYRNAEIRPLSRIAREYID